MFSFLVVVVPEDRKVFLLCCGGLCIVLFLLWRDEGGSVISFEAECCKDLMIILSSHYRTRPEATNDVSFVISCFGASRAI
jgi:hypothetical protein